MIGESAGLLFKIKGDASDAIRAFDQTKRGATDLTAATGGTASSMAALAGPAAIAAVAVTAVAGAALAGVKALFNLASSASEYGSAIFDASQKTGLGAETMSALKIAAEQSGSSFDSITSSISKFNVLLGQAAAGNDKAEKTLKQYGITATDTQGALEQAITRIAGMASASDQAAAAAALFKDRTGEILPVIKSFDGDLPGLLNKLREMGLLMSDEDAKAADEFGDQMDMLNTQLANVGRTIGFQVMPAFNKMAADLSRWLSKNKSEVSTWGVAFGVAMDNAYRNISSIIQFVKNNEFWFRILLGTAGNAALEHFAEQVRRRQAQEAKDSAGAFDFGTLTPAERKALSPLGSGGAGGGDGEAAQEAEKRSKEREAERKRELSAQSDQNQKLLNLDRQAFDDAQKLLEGLFIKREITEKEYRERSEQNFETYATRIKDLLNSAFAVDSIDKTDTEKENLNLVRLSGERALNSEIVRERDGMEKTITSVTKQGADERKKVVEKEMADIIALSQAKTNTLIAEFESLKSKGIISEVQYTEIVGALKRQQLEQERALTDDAKKRALIDEEIKQQNIQNATEVSEAISKAAKAYDEYRESVWNAQIAQAEFNARQRELEEQTAIEEGTFFGGGFFESLISGWRQFYEQIVADAPTLKQVFQDLGGIIGGAFQGMANAIGNVVQQWVLYGNTGPAVMRKILASALATIAAEAAVRALWELALGFATLFFNPAESVAHFTAAAIFGTIAGVAAIAGRAVAGNAFKQQSGQAAGSTAGSTGANQQGSPNRAAGAYSSLEPITYESGINQPTIRGEILVKLGLDSDGVIQVLEQNIRTNGRFKGLIFDTANA